jgi:hypothetical protein
MAVSEFVVEVLRAIEELPAESVVGDDDSGLRGCFGFGGVAGNGGCQRRLNPEWKESSEMALEASDQVE